jgi:hypothetical protein
MAGRKHFRILPGDTLRERLRQRHATLALKTAMLLAHGPCGKPHLHFLQTLKKYAD